MQKIIPRFSVIIGLIMVVLAGIFYWKNFRGSRPALQKAPLEFPGFLFIRKIVITNWLICLPAGTTLQEPYFLALTVVFTSQSAPLAILAWKVINGARQFT